MNRQRPNAAVLHAARELEAEGAAQAIVPTLAQRGVDAIVLKGPALGAWLYREGERRGFSDLDLLVDPGSIGIAEGVLRERGYARGQPGWDELSFAWRRGGERFAIDLHRSIVGAGAAPEVVWERLRAHAVERELLGVRCRCLDEAGLAMHAATHAAQHALDGDRKPLEDLRRALAVADRETWRDAVTLARAIDAEPALVAGLRRLPAGAELASSLGLDETAMPLDVALRAADDPPPLVLGIEQLRRIEGPRAQLRFAASKLFPPRAQMRAGSALAARGGAGLALAYALRPLRVAVELPRALSRHRSLARAADEQRAQNVDHDDLGEGDQRQRQPPADPG